MRVARRIGVLALSVMVLASPLVASDPAWAAGDGTPDTAFTVNTGSGFNSSVYSVAVQSDGKIVVGGSFTELNGVTSNRIARLNADGTPDTTFSSKTGSGFGGGVVRALAVQSDGKIVAGGAFTTLNGETRNRIVRFNADGTPDTTFSNNTGSGFNGAEVYSVVVQSDGKIVVGGDFTTLKGQTTNRIARLNVDGTPDTAFTTSTGTGFDTTVTSVAVQADGKIVVGGSFTTLNGQTSNRIARLNVDGTPDAAFSLSTGAGFNSGVNGVAVQPDGKIVVGGSFTTLNGQTSNRIARLNIDGTPDTTFTANTGIGFSASSTYSFAVQSDGKIVVGGSFTTLNGQTSNRIARLNIDGTPDTTFTANTGTGFSNGVLPVALQSDGKIVVGGHFTTLNGQTTNRIARLLGGAGGLIGSVAPPGGITFVFLTSDGAPCFTDSAVSAGAYNLPTSAVACTPEGSELVGWAIPGQKGHFSDGGTVIATADQTFTAVAKNPTISVLYDPNVGRESGASETFAPCLSSSGANLNTAADAAWTTKSTARDGLLAVSPVCAPSGMRFLGWTDQPTTNGVNKAVEGAITLAGGSPVPASWSQDPDPVNTVHLYAMWG